MGTARARYPVATDQAMVAGDPYRLLSACSRIDMPARVQFRQGFPSTATFTLDFARFRYVFSSLYYL
jgi:hypothetical protein